jgi:ferric-dicitrate binding protein FerR (iron transport regulator)
MNYLRRSTAILVCFLISPLAQVAQPLPQPQPAPQGTQKAGQIQALIPAATRNAQPTKVQDEIDWNDLLKTAHSGRVRAGLTDGSILSVGSDSELRVVQHDATSQQTSLELSYGKVRNQVTTITKSGGKYELKTPNAVIGVIGTDFVAEYKGNKTTVYCIKGKVSVTPLGKIVKNTGTQGSASNSVTLTDGQMVIVTNAVPTAGLQPSNTPPDVSQGALLATDVPDNGQLPPPGKGPHGALNGGGGGLKTIIIGGAIATGIGVGLGVGLGPGPSGERCPPANGGCR